MGDIKDYKAMAGINKEFLKPYIDKLVYKTYVSFQADYFEKEDKIIEKQQIKTHGILNYAKFIDSFDRFDRKQFKEWCEVE